MVFMTVLVYVTVLQKKMYVVNAEVQKLIRIIVVVVHGMVMLAPWILIVFM